MKLSLTDIIDFEYPTALSNSSEVASSRLRAS